MIHPFLSSVHRARGGFAFGDSARFSISYACFESENTLDEMYDLDKTPLEGSCDVFKNEKFPSLGFDNIVISNPLDYSHV